ncbi:hypothetical protein BS47DRAFT_469370 [Hydnum rufescens UP504]|uniref:URB1 N-terminal domain-containing protein n=1 Tax=Hydnum rufescens UP504 TaxID=1448309 RepID=A0A9P6E0C8_9AGAM|nr:hypothetical protein BS47DRAFT_469370 [Hydnum rufescens UP504]
MVSSPGPEGNDEVSDSKSRSGRIHNVTLANFLKSLKVNEDPRQQELAIKILGACPEIIQGYWSVAGISLEPRLSSRWITNMAYFGAIISLPIPTYCFSTVLSKGSLSTPSYNPSPPPLNTIVENVIPSIFTKVFVTKGLQLNSEPLVRHCTSLALAKCLDKFESIRQAFTTVEAALEENEETGQWMRRRLELEKEVRRRVPDFQVVVALSQRNVSALASTSALAAATVVDQSQPGEATRNELLSEASLRLMWLYHRSLPSLAAEARFDPGKLLLSMTRQGQQHHSSRIICSC